MQNHVNSMNTRSIVKSEQFVSRQITVYREGDAMVREQRMVTLSAGENLILIENLPDKFVVDYFDVLFAWNPQGFCMNTESFEPATFDDFEMHIPAAGRSTSEAVEARVDEDGVYKFDSAYELSGISWQVDYSMLYDEEDGQMRHFLCQLKITNESGTDLQDARLSFLSTPDAPPCVRLIVPGEMNWESSKSPSRIGAAMSTARGECVVYAVDQAISILNGQRVQHELVNALHVPVIAELYAMPGPYYENIYEEKLPVAIRLRFRNSQECNLGAPLPGGCATLHRLDSAGTDHATTGIDFSPVAVGEECSIELKEPSATVTVIRRLGKTKEFPDFWDEPVSWNFIEERVIEVTNIGAKSETVFVYEELPEEFDLVCTSMQFLTSSPGQGVFKVIIPPYSSTTVRYTIMWTLDESLGEWSGGMAE